MCLVLEDEGSAGEEAAVVEEVPAAEMVVAAGEKVVA